MPEKCQCFQKEQLLGSVGRFFNFPVPDAEFYTLKWDCCVVPGQVTYKIMLRCSDLLKSGKTNSLLGLLNWMCTCCSVVSCNVNLNEQWDPAESKKHCCLFSLALPTHERSQSAVIYIVMLFENSLSLDGLFFLMVDFCWGLVVCICST